MRLFLAHRALPIHNATTCRGLRVIAHDQRPRQLRVRRQGKNRRRDFRSFPNPSLVVLSSYLHRNPCRRRFQSACSRDTIAQVAQFDSPPGDREHLRRRGNAHADPQHLHCAAGSDTSAETHETPRAVICRCAVHWQCSISVDAPILSAALARSDQQDHKREPHLHGSNRSGRNRGVLVDDCTHVQCRNDRRLVVTDAFLSQGARGRCTGYDRRRVDRIPWKACHWRTRPSKPHGPNARADAIGGTDDHRVFSPVFGSAAGFISASAFFDFAYCSPASTAPTIGHRKRHSQLDDEQRSECRWIQDLRRNRVRPVHLPGIALRDRCDRQLHNRRPAIRPDILLRYLGL